MWLFIIYTLEKELKSDKTVTYKISFINSLRFISSSLSILTDDLAEGIGNSKCTDYKSRLEHVKVKDKLLIFNYLGCNKNYDKDLIF